jgi:hypothetical protein
MQALETALVKTAGTWEQAGSAEGKVREVIGAVDETFLEQLIRILLDVSTGYLLLEEVAEDRTYATWKALVDERLKALGTGVLYLVSDRAKALIQLAEHGLECLSMPDVFHLMHDIVKSYSLAIARQVRQAQQALQHAEEVLTRPPGLYQPGHDGPEAKAQVEGCRVAVQQWEEVQHTYRHHLETLSLPLHPFGINWLRVLGTAERA